MLNVHIKILLNNFGLWIKCNECLTFDVKV